MVKKSKLKVQIKSLIPRRSQLENDIPYLFEPREKKNMRWGGMGMFSLFDRLVPSLIRIGIQFTHI
jgi:hypothetical protein